MPNLLPNIKRLSDILEANEIEHWVDFGSLLGAVREGSLIPGDHDFDFGFYKGDQEGLCRLAPRILDECRLHLMDCGRIVRLFWADGDVDLATERTALDSTQAQGVMFVDFYPCLFADRRVVHTLPKHDFRSFFVDELEEVTIDGHVFPAPRHREAFLVNRYGPNWKVPMTREEFETKQDSLIVPFKPEYSCYIQGVFDLFHEGHVELLARAKLLFETVIVGVDTIDNVLRYKDTSVYDHDARVQLVWSCRHVDEVVYDPPPTATVDFLDGLGADYALCGREDEAFLRQFWQPIMDVDRLHVIERTEGVSTSSIKEKIRG